MPIHIISHKSSGGPWWSPIVRIAAMVLHVVDVAAGARSARPCAVGLAGTVSEFHRAQDRKDLGCCVHGSVLLSSGAKASISAIASEIKTPVKSSNQYHWGFELSSKK